MYVCTEKAAIQEWLKEIEELKAENKRFEELLTKSWDKRIEILIKENKELRAENKELKEEVKKRKMVADENWTGYDMMKDEYEKLEKENKELKLKLNLLTNQK
jgi:cell division septum initiation protein DivIVA